MFTLTEGQHAQIKEFMDSHDCKLIDDFGFRHTGAIGGEVTYCFTPTGLGTIEIVKCACGASLNLTDFDSW